MTVTAELVSGSEEKDKDSEYPCLKKSSNGLIVLFTGKEEGFVVKDYFVYREVPLAFQSARRVFSAVLPEPVSVC